MVGPAVADGISHQIDLLIDLQLKVNWRYRWICVLEADRARSQSVLGVTEAISKVPILAICLER